MPSPPFENPAHASAFYKFDASKLIRRVDQIFGWYELRTLSYADDFEIRAKRVKIRERIFLTLFL